MALSSKEKTPVYAKLKQMIIKEIDNGSLQSDAPILSERLLGKKFDISRISVRKAIKELVEENFLYTIPGKGTFVRGVSSSEAVPVEKRTYNLGYVFWGAVKEEITNQYFAHLIHGAEKESLKHNYHMLVSTAERRNEAGEVDIPSFVNQRKVDGVFLEGVDIQSYEKINRIRPAVIISNYILIEGKPSHFEQADYVAANNQLAVLNILHYLKDLGHKKVAFIYESLNHSSFLERHDAFRQSVSQLDMKTKDDWVIKAKTGFDGLKALIKKSEQPTAIVAANDWYAVDMLENAHKIEIKVPDDISIVGFDDIEAAAWSNPSLTTVRVFTDEVGKVAANRLIEKIEEPDSPPRTMYVGTKLIPRDSCRKIK
jgi:DNA-binding LacI/PurR family transcriptional regulator